MARPSMTTRQLIDLFKKLVRFILETCSDEVDANLFRTSHVNGIRLRAVAIHHAMPSVNCVPIWSNETAFIITRAILKQKGRMTKAMMKDHENGILELPWSNMNLKGVPSFRSIISFGPVLALQSHINNRCTVDPSPIVHNNPELSDYFACPKCHSFRNIERCSLLVSSGWRHILCFNCRATSRSMTWKCICDVPWHTCIEHSSRIRVSEAEPPEVLQQIVLS